MYFLCVLFLLQGLSIRQIRFRFDGQPINETDTPSQVHCTDNWQLSLFSINALYSLYSLISFLITLKHSLSDAIILVSTKAHLLSMNLITFSLYFPLHLPLMESLYLIPPPSISHMLILSLFSWRWRMKTP